MLDNIENIFIINLQEDLGRYNHSLFELSKLNLNKINFVKAVHYGEDVVKEFYKSKRVKKFTSCFRCDDSDYGKNYCEHDNNIITPMQVGNFLSFKKVMKMKLDSNGLGMVLEDDFYLKPKYDIALKNVSIFIKKNKLENINEPLLIRIGSHTKVRKRYRIIFKLFKKNIFPQNHYNMANPAFIFNNKFAQLFLDNFHIINTTSDNFIHKILCKDHKVKNFSVYPFPISQYTHKSDNKKFLSSIDKESKEKLFKNYVKNKDEYDELFDLWVN